MSNSLSLFQNIEESHFEEEKDIARYSTMRLKAVGNLVEVFSLSALKKVLSLCLKKKISYHLIGGGSNQIYPSFYRGVYIKLKLPFDKSTLDNKAHDQYILPASVSLGLLTTHALRYGLKGWEVFTGIPASLGGAIYMNAGTGLGEISSLVKKVKIMNSQGNIREEKITKKSFGYRKNYFLNPGDIVVEGTLIHHGIDSQIPLKIKKYLEYRNQTQPLGKLTCGCVFKNYNLKGLSCKAGHLIDIIGLKGLSFKEIKVSYLHANFIENDGGHRSSLDDMRALISFIQEELKLQLGLDLETEIILPQI